MRAYLVRRLVASAAVLVGVTFLIFLLVRLLPGDPVEVMLGTETSVPPAVVAELRRSYGLDRPILVQYVEWLGKFGRGDLGRSLRTGDPVLRDLLRFVPVTLELALVAMLIAVLVGLPLGTVAAIKRQTWVDVAALAGGLVGLSVPGFWFATLVILVGSRFFGWSPPLSLTPFQSDPLGHLKQMVLPALSLSLVTTAFILRMTRSAVLEVLHKEYVWTARAKGLSERAVIRRHVLRNALIPIVTVIGFQLGVVLGGSVVIETIFTLPGLGTMLLKGVLQRDYPVVQGAVFYIAAAFVMLNLLVDCLYGYLYPRVEYD